MSDRKSTATCIIPNCRKVAPAHEPFCSDHRDRAAKWRGEPDEERTHDSTSAVND